MYGEFENTFMMYLPRLCEHCLTPLALPPVQAFHLQARGRRIVLIDQTNAGLAHVCFRLSVQKNLLQLETGKSEKCTFCYPRIEAGEPTVCSETCVGRIRYLGVLLYDADRIEAAASCENEQDLYQQQLDIFLDPNDEDVRAEARAAVFLSHG